MISSHEYNEGKVSWNMEILFSKWSTRNKREINGVRIGKWIYYHENGLKSQISRYLNGKKHGVWKVYDENGNLTIEQME